MTSLLLPMRWGLLLVALFWTVPLLAATEGSAGSTEAGDSKGPVMLGKIRVDPASHSAIATGWVNMVEGPIEFLACGPGGKTHESIFILDADTVDLHAALLLLGLKPGKGPSGLGVGQPEGPECTLWVEWTSGDESHRKRAESFILDHETQARLPDTGWVFTGSHVHEGKYMATVDQSFVATYWDPWAIINIPLACGADDEILMVRTEATPPKGTPIRLVFETRFAQAKATTR